MTDFTFPQGYINAPPTASRGLYILGSDGTNTGSITIANILGQLSTSDGAAGSFLTSSSLTGYAQLASPTFTGTPAAPTATPGTVSTQLATTAFVSNAISSVGGVSSVVSQTGAITLSQLVSAGLAPIASPTFTGTPNVPGYVTTTFANSTYAPLASPNFTGTPSVPGYLTSSLASSTYATLNSPTFTGVPAAPTASSGTNTTQLATTAFVTAAVSASTTGVSSVLGNTGAVTLNQLVTGGVAPLASPTFTGSPTVPGYLTTSNANSTYAPLASPTFSGTVTVPNITAGDNTSKAANTAYVYTAVNATVVSLIGLTGTVTLSQLVSNGVAPLASPTFTGTPTVPGYATLASPTFTGNVIVPNVTTGDNSTKAANTAFVATAVSGSTTSVIGNTGAVTLAQLVTGGVAPLASPALTGTPSAPTATTGTNTTQLATTAFVAASVSAATTGVSSVLGNTGAIILSQLVTGGVAPLASPALTGTPTAPTATSSTNTTQLATTAFVATAVGSSVVSVIGNTGVVTLAQLVTGGVAPLASPTLTGTVSVTGTFTTSSSRALHTTLITSGSSYTVASTDDMVLINKTSGSSTSISLPSSPVTGRFVTIKDAKGDSNTNIITVSPAAGTIDGAVSKTINVSYGSMDLIYNGTSWSIV